MVTVLLMRYKFSVRYINFLKVSFGLVNLTYELLVIAMKGLKNQKKVIEI